MFISKEVVKASTGVDVDATTLATAQLMVESYVGRSDSEVTDAGDRATLGRATAFQAVYINGKPLDMLEQVGIKRITVGATDTQFDSSMFAPYMSPWAVMACKGLSWMGTRTVHTGPVFDYTPPVPSWESF